MGAGEQHEQQQTLNQQISAGVGAEYDGRPLPQRCATDVQQLRLLCQAWCIKETHELL